MRDTKVWVRLLGLRRAVIEDVLTGDEGEVVVRARPNWRERDRCGVCLHRSPGFDLGEGRRRWRRWISARRSRSSRAARRA